MKRNKGKKPQDREREDLLVKMFDLTPANKNRIGIDAIDEFKNSYELKTTTKSGVSTARDVGLNHLKKWRNLYWIFAKGCYVKDQFIIEEIYFLSPTDLEVWFRKIESKLIEKNVLFERIIQLLQQYHFTQKEIEQIEYIFQRGVLLNDPNIPWSYIQSHGIRIDSDYSITLRNIIKNIPPISSKKSPKSTLSQFFD